MRSVELTLRAVLHVPHRAGGGALALPRRPGPGGRPRVLLLDAERQRRRAVRGAGQPPREVHPAGEDGLQVQRLPRRPRIGERR